MTVAKTLETYLVQRQVNYDTRTHPAAPSSARTAEAAHLPGHRVAKAVVLKRSDDSYMLMVLPADQMVHLGRLHRLLDEDVGLATEGELAALFPDCAVGAVPALGQAYGLHTLVDSSLFDLPEVFIESGDHQTLVHLNHQQFDQLLGSADRVDAVRHI